MGTLIGRGFLLRVVMIIVCLLVSGIGNIYVGVGITFILFVGYVLFMFAESSSAGEEQCTMTDTVRRIREQGKQPSDTQLSKCFAPMNGLVSCAILVAPGLGLAIANLITANPDSASQTILGIITRIYFMPEIFLTRLCTELVKVDISATVNAAIATAKAFRGGSLNTSTLLTGTAALDSVYSYVTDMSSIRLLNILYIPISFIPPLAMLIGYLRGPKLRAKTLNDMMTGSNKKLRRMRKTKTHQPKVQKPEV